LSTYIELSRADDGGHLWRVEVASSWLARLRGLIGRSRLVPGEGLYLPGTNSIHMLFMRFAIDCVFVGSRGADGTAPVVAVHERLAPWRGVVWWVRHAKGAIELPAGSAAHAGVKPGDYLRLG
jgi:hypothetical protein